MQDGKETLPGPGYGGGLRAKRKDSEHCRSMALVVTLGMIVLITIMVVAFLAAVSLDRQATASYSRSLQADSVALGGLDQVISQIETEIYANSFTNGSATNAIYQPLNNGYAVPERMSTFPTLVTYSGVPVFTNGANLAIAGAYTTNSSLNNRIVSMSVWNEPQLTLTTAGFPVPQWILVTRNGTFPTGWTNSVFSNSSLANQNFVLGRYAYVVYDTSGLIDVNAAGYPSSQAANATNKGVLPWADLTQLTNSVKQPDVDNLVNWRNATTASNYAAYVTNWATNGFMNVAQGDTTFLSRQDLIKYAQNENPDLTAALPFLTTFSREVNGPTWGPTTNAGVLLATNNYNYQINSTATGSFNPLIYNPRVQVAFTRNNGTQAVVGEPLVKYRFPLDKLALLEKMQGSGTLSAAELTEIQQYFGLDLAPDVTGSTGFYRHWIYPTTSTTYVHGVGSGTSGIMSLDDVALEGREPDFFELLQAGILQGSLGVYSTYQTTSTLMTHARADLLAGISSNLQGIATSDPDQKKTLQILRIGANIIDQWHADNFPTTLTYTDATKKPVSVYGICDLPYISSVAANFYNTPANMAGGTANGPTVYLCPQLWNPHQPSGATNTPTQFEIVPDAADLYNFSYYAPGVGGGGQWNKLNGAVFSYAGGTAFTSTGNNNQGYNIPGYNTTNFIVFTDSGNVYREPTMITNAISGNASGYWHPSGTGTNSAIGCIQWTLPLPINTQPGAAMSPTNSWATIAAAVPVHTTPPYQIWWDQATNTANDSLFFNTGQGTNTISNAPIYQIDFKWTGVLDIKFYNPANSTYYPYSSFMGVPNWTTNQVYTGQSTPSIFAPVITNTAPLPYANTFIKGDPRTSRFGWVSMDYTDIEPGTGFTTPRGNPWVSLNPTPTTLANLNQAENPFVQGLPQGGNPYRIDLWAVNNPSLVKHATDTTTNIVMNNCYTDPDGTYRYGDANYAYTNAAGFATPYLTGAQQNRPVVLHRPFRSVGELGYAFRDDPWRSLDFSSPTSADAALLDLFTVNDGQVVPEPNGQLTELTAGKVNPNTPYPSVLAALMAGTAQNRLTGTSAATNVLATNSAFSLATNLVTLSSSAPIMNRADLVTRFMTNATAASLYLKGDREAVIRSLAESSNTRTWNFLIDIVGQSGIYPTTATSPDNFVVTGERHYWLHVAIDRFTGQVVAKQLEMVEQ